MEQSVLPKSGLFSRLAAWLFRFSSMDGIFVRCAADIRGALVSDQSKSLFGECLLVRESRARRLGDDLN